MSLRRKALFVRRVPGSGVVPPPPSLFDVYFFILSTTQIDNLWDGNPMGPGDPNSTKGYNILTQQQIDDLLNS